MSSLLLVWAESILGCVALISSIFFGKAVILLYQLLICIFFAHFCLPLSNDLIDILSINDCVSNFPN